MGIEKIKTTGSDPKISDPVSIPVSPLDSSKLKQEVEKKIRGPYKKKDKEDIQRKGWDIFPKAKTEVSEEDEEKFRLVCYSAGIQKSIQALYKKGLMIVIVTDFKFAKIDTKFLPKEPVTQAEAEVWALSLTDFLIEENGSASTLKVLRPLVLIGQPLIAITQAHVEGKADQILKNIDTAIKDKENAPIKQG